MLSHLEQYIWDDILFSSLPCHRMLGDRMPLCQDSWSRPMTSLDCTSFFFFSLRRNLPFSFVADFYWPIRIYPEWFAVGRSLLHVLERWYWSFERRSILRILFFLPKISSLMLSSFFFPEIYFESDARIGSPPCFRLVESITDIELGFVGLFPCSGKDDTTILLTLLDFPWVEGV